MKADKSQKAAERAEAERAEKAERERAILEQKRERLFSAIEQTQAFMHKKQPTDAFMKNVRSVFPAPLYFIEANRRAMMRAGIPRLDAFYYSIIPCLARTTRSQQWGPHPNLSVFSAMSAYLKTLYVGVHIECFYLVLLNGNGKLIRPVLLQKGSEDSAPFYLRQVLSTVLREEARYFVLAHNHPGGTLKPSNEDLRCTLRALNAFAPLGVPMLDHVIVAADKVVSIRNTGLIPELLWKAVAPKDRFVLNWIDRDVLYETDD